MLMRNANRHQQRCIPFWVSLSHGVTQVERDTSIKTGCSIAADSGNLKCDGDVIASGYSQLGLTTGAPPAADCDEASEHGRMKVDADVGVSLLYVCTADE